MVRSQRLGRAHSGAAALTALGAPCWPLPKPEVPAALRPPGPCAGRAPDHRAGPGLSAQHPGDLSAGPEGSQHPAFYLLPPRQTQGAPGGPPCADSPESDAPSSCPVWLNQVESGRRCLEEEEAVSSPGPSRVSTLALPSQTRPRGGGLHFLFLWGGHFPKATSSSCSALRLS